MRLNLKQLPNITKPIPVPQNIIDNFYKDYNLSSHNVITNRAFRNLKRNVSQIRGEIIEDFEDKESTPMKGDNDNTVKEFPNIYKENPTKIRTSKKNSN